jgi:hypothetical protein
MRAGLPKDVRVWTFYALGAAFQIDRAEFPEPAEAMAAPLDPDDDRRVQLLAGAPDPAVLITASSRITRG